MSGRPYIVNYLCFYIPFIFAIALIFSLLYSNIYYSFPFAYRSRSYGRGASSSASTSSRRRTSRTERPRLTEADLEGKSAEEIEMLKTMGFCTFDTTKNRKVDGNDVGEVHVILKRKYRQYMNRKGGFNRPLDFVA